MGLFISKEMPRFWGIPFVVYLYDGVFNGKVRLNKILSLLQREGFPIDNIFVNAEMGPHDETLDLEVGQLQDDKVLEYEQVPTPYENDMSVYKLTEKGFSFVNNEVRNSVNNLPYSEGFIRSLIKIKGLQYKKTEDLVKMVHEDLYLDNLNKFLDETHKTYDLYKELHQSMKENFVNYCTVYLQRMGMVEFTIESLKRVIEEEYRFNKTGKNHVLYNSKLLFDLLDVNDIRKNNQFIQCKKSGCCECSKCPISDYLLEHRFHCIEYNSTVYDIQKMIDYREYDFEEIFN